MSDPVILNSLPVLQSLAKKFESDEELRSALAKTAFLLVQHTQHSTASLFQSLHDLGAKYNNMFHLGKVYSEMPSAKKLIESFKDESGEMHVLCHARDEITFYQNRFKEECFQPAVQEVMERFADHLKNHQELERIIVLDDGGVAMGEMHRRFESPEFIKREICFVEQTAAGSRDMIMKFDADKGLKPEDKMSVPLVMVSSSLAKNTFEPALVEEAVAKSTEAVFSRFSEEDLASLTIGVIGYGPIGKAVAAGLRKRGHMVTVFDLSGSKQQESVKDGFESVKSVAELIKGSDVIFGASGKDATKEQLSDIRQAMSEKDRPTLFASASSENKEFFSLIEWCFSQDQKPVMSKHHEDEVLSDLSFTIDQKKVTFCRGGYPINFAPPHYSIPKEHIQVVMGCLLGGIIEGCFLARRPLKRLIGHKRNYHRLGAIFQNLSVKYWLEACPEMGFRCDLDKLAYFNNLDRIELFSTYELTLSTVKRHEFGRKDIYSCQGEVRRRKLIEELVEQSKIENYSLFEALKRQSIECDEDKLRGLCDEFNREAIIGEEHSVLEKMMSLIGQPIILLKEKKSDDLAYISLDHSNRYEIELPENAYANPGMPIFIRSHEEHYSDLDFEANKENSTIKKYELLDLLLQKPIEERLSRYNALQETIDITRYSEERFKEPLRIKYKRESKIQRLFYDDKIDVSEIFTNLAIIGESQQRSERKVLSGLNNRDKAEDAAEVIQDHRLSSFEQIYSVKNPINLDQVFEKKIIENNTEQTIILNKLLIAGRAGIGKTTLCKYIANQWIDGKLWNDRFKWLFWIPLRNLSYARYKNLREELSIADIVFQECFNVNCAYDVKKENIEEIFQNQNNKHKIILILDGFDEIAQLNVPGTIIGDILNALINFEDTIITSRPYSIAGLPKDRNLEVMGFTEDKIEKYIIRFFQQRQKPELIEQVLTQIEQNKHIWGTAHIPINLEMICSLCEQEKLELNENLTMTNLYSSIVNEWMYRYGVKQRIIRGGEDRSDQEHVMSEELFLLEEIANDMMLQDTIFHEPGSILNIINHMKLSGFKKDRLRSRMSETGLIKDIGEGIDQNKKGCYFIHLSFQEYFAARYWVRKYTSSLVTEQNIAKEILSNNKCNPTYEIVWWFVAGSLSELHDQHAITLFEHDFLEKIDCIGIYSSLLHINCFNECKKSFSGRFAIRVRSDLYGWIKLYLFEQRKFPDSLWHDIFSNSINPGLSELEYADLHAEIFGVINRLKVNSTIKALNVLSILRYNTANDKELRKLCDVLFQLFYYMPIDYYKTHEYKSALIHTILYVYSYANQIGCEYFIKKYSTLNVSLKYKYNCNILDEIVKISERSNAIRKRNLNIFLEYMLLDDQSTAINLHSDSIIKACSIFQETGIKYILELSGRLNLNRSLDLEEDDAIGDSDFILKLFEGLSEINRNKLIDIILQIVVKKNYSECGRLLMIILLFKQYIIPQQTDKIVNICLKHIESHGQYDCYIPFKIIKDMSSLISVDRQSEILYLIKNNIESYEDLWIIEILIEFKKYFLPSLLEKINEIFVFMLQKSSVGLKYAAAEVLCRDDSSYLLVLIDIWREKISQWRTAFSLNNNHNSEPSIFNYELYCEKYKSDAYIRAIDEFNGLCDSFKDAPINVIVSELNNLFNIYYFSIEKHIEFMGIIVKYVPVQQKEQIMQKLIDLFIRSQHESFSTILKALIEVASELSFAVFCNTLSTRLKDSEVSMLICTKSLKKMEKCSSKVPLSDRPQWVAMYQQLVANYGVVKDCDCISDIDLIDASNIDEAMALNNIIEEGNIDDSMSENNIIEEGSINDDISETNITDQFILKNDISDNNSSSLVNSLIDSFKNAISHPMILEVSDSLIQHLVHMSIDERLSVNAVMRDSLSDHEGTIQEDAALKVLGHLIFFLPSELKNKAIELIESKIQNQKRFSLRSDYAFLGWLIHVSNTGLKRTVLTKLVNELKENGNTVKISSLTLQENISPNDEQTRSLLTKLIIESAIPPERIYIKVYKIMLLEKLFYEFELSSFLPSIAEMIIFKCMFEKTIINSKEDKLIFYNNKIVTKYFCKNSASIINTICSIRKKLFDVSLSVLANNRDSVASETYDELLVPDIDESDEAQGMSSSVSAVTDDAEPLNDRVFWRCVLQ